MNRLPQLSIARRQHIGDVYVRGLAANNQDALARQLRNLRGSAPEVMKAFAEIAQTALAAKALDAKTKELLSLSPSGSRFIADDCIAFHVKAALEKGCHTRGNHRDTWHGNLHGCAGPVSDVRQPTPFAALQQFEAAHADCTSLRLSETYLVRRRTSTRSI